VYHPICTVGALSTGALLPFTGINAVWIILAAFTFVATGLALLRLVPRRNV